MKYFVILTVIIVAVSAILFHVFALQENDSSHPMAEILPANNTYGQTQSVSGWVFFMDTNSVANIYLNYPTADFKIKKMKLTMQFTL